ncbi:MAG TPA: nucleotidyltransferase family protein [Clostridiaceae bacterium]|nr:nucleotidyltransferase family protein [Clostridiaceae bacterium]
MINEGRYIVELIRAVLEERKAEVDNIQVNYEKLLKLAELHYVTGICYRAIKDGSGVPEDILLKMRKSYDMTCAKEAIQEIEVNMILEKLESSGIKHMPLKGFILKNIYPRPDMRLSADVDILIDEEKTNEVEKIMVSLGYTPMSKGVHHDVYHKKPVMNVEMHKKLMSDLVEIYDYFKDAWEKAVKKEGKQYEYMQSLEDFYIYQMGHLYKHYSKGGSGIRSVLDTYIYLKRYEDILDRGYLDKEFEKMGILDFVSTYEQLSFNWFEEGRVDDELSLYILSSGVFGTRYHSVLSSTIKKASGEESIKKLKFKYLVNRIFLITT